MKKQPHERVVGAVATAFVILAVPSAALGQRCGRVAVPTRGSAKVRVVRGPLTCRAARRQLARAYRAEDTRRSDGFDPVYGVFWDVDGWRCFIGLAGSQTFCDRGVKRVDGSLRRDDGWSF